MKVRVRIDKEINFKNGKGRDNKRMVTTKIGIKKSITKIKIRRMSLECVVIVFTANEESNL